MLIYLAGDGNNRSRRNVHLLGSNDVVVGYPRALRGVWSDAFGWRVVITHKTVMQSRGNSCCNGIVPTRADVSSVELPHRRGRVSP
jgi:hypothetical protein